MQRAMVDLQHEMRGLHDKVNTMREEVKGVELRNKAMNDEIKDLRVQLDIMQKERIPSDGSERALRAVQLYEKFDHPDGKRRRVPPGWKLPVGLVQHAYLYWHCGDPTRKISPIKMLNKNDVSFLEGKDKINLYAMRRMMGIIDRAAIAEGVLPKKDMPMTEDEANACFAKGCHGIKVAGETPTGRPRNVLALRWTSLVKLLHSDDRKEERLLPTINDA